MKPHLPECRNKDTGNAAVFTLSRANPDKAGVRRTHQRDVALEYDIRLYNQIVDDR